MNRVLIIATVQSHVCQFHKPLVSMLREKGFTVSVAARDNLSEKNGLKLDFADEVFDVPFARSPFSPKNIRAYRMLKGIMESGDYDIIHCNTPVGGVLGRLAARKKRRKGAKIIYTAHGFHFYKGAPIINWLLWYPIERIMSRMTDTLITIADEDYELAKRKMHCKVRRIHGVGADESRFFPIAEPQKTEKREEMGFSSRQKLILNFGELLPNKNQSMAIRAMKTVIKTYPDALLLIAGNGPEEEKLKGEAISLGLSDNVRFLGYVTNPQDYQQIADACVACSFREGLPQNVVEAMLCKTPLVVTDNRGHRELVINGQSGFVVPPDDADAMAQRLIALFDDEVPVNKLCRLAEKTAADYTADNVKRELEGIYFDE